MGILRLLQSHIIRQENQPQQKKTLAPLAPKGSRLWNPLRTGMRILAIAVSLHGSTGSDATMASTKHARPHVVAKRIILAKGCRQTIPGVPVAVNL